MRVCFCGLRNVVQAIAVLVFLVSCPSPGFAATEYAPIMPQAPRSLLLDGAVAGQRVLVAGERGHILYSDDHGCSWQQAMVPTTQMLTAIHFIDAQRGWAVGHDGLILVSDDAGGKWRIQRDGIAAQQQANLQMREQAHQQLAALEQALASAGEEQRSDLEMQMEEALMDLEDADLALEEEVFTSPLFDIWFQDPSRGWAVGAFGTLLATDNGGQSWTNQAAAIDNPDEFHLNAITGDGRGRVFIAGEGGVMFRSLDGGRTWETLDAFYEGSWFGTLYSVAADALLVFGLRGNLYRSEDFGASWQPVGGDNSISLAGGSPGPSGEIAIVGSVGTVLHSRDGGQTFKPSVLADRLSLSSALYSGGRLLLMGQGGVRIYGGDGDGD